MESFGWISLLESLPLASRDPLPHLPLSLSLSPRLNRVPSLWRGKKAGRREKDQEELFPSSCRKDGRSRFSNGTADHSALPFRNSKLTFPSPLFSMRPRVPEDLAGYRQRFELSARAYSLSSLDALITPIKYSNTLECIIHRSASFSSENFQKRGRRVRSTRVIIEAFFNEIPCLTLRKRNLTPGREGC